MLPPFTGQQPHGRSLLLITTELPPTHGTPPDGSRSIYVLPLLTCTCHEAGGRTQGLTQTGQVLYQGDRYPQASPAIVWVRFLFLLLSVTDWVCLSVCLLACLWEYTRACHTLCQEVRGQHSGSRFWGSNSGCQPTVADSFTIQVILTASAPFIW